MGRLISRARSIWRWLKANWKAAFAGLSVLLVAIYVALSKRNRKQAIRLKGEAQRAEGGKVERVKDAAEARHKAFKHGQKANKHQERAGNVIEKLRKKEGKRMGAAEARELAERIAGEG